MSTTDKALHDNKLSQLALGGGAAASHPPAPGCYEGYATAFRRHCARHGTDAALLHRRVRQLRWKLRGERGRYGFSCYLS